VRDCFDPISFSGFHRMDNLLKCHTYVFCLQPPTLTRSIKSLQTYAAYFRDATLDGATSLCGILGAETIVASEKL
jgi:hypothetical protein